MFSRKCCVYIFAIILLIYGKHSECSHHTIQTIDALAQNYLNAERNLWHLVHLTELNNNDDALLHIYETHEEFLDKHFGETGIFDSLGKQQQQQPRNEKYDDQRIMERHAGRMIDSIDYINITALNTYRFLNHRQFDQLPSLIEDILENMPRTVSTLGRYADFNFWIFVRNVGTSEIGYWNNVFQFFLHFFFFS